MSAIVDVTNWRDLGLQLGLSSARLNEIDEGQEPKQMMIEQWMKTDPGASWKKLLGALTTPALCENRTAKDIVERHDSSFDREEIQSKGSGELWFVASLLIL
jgi:pyrroloquinoline quinone (PQQ) biosynthesis protein C